LNNRSLINSLVNIIDLYQNFKYLDAINLFKEVYSDDLLIDEKAAEIHLKILFESDFEKASIIILKYLNEFENSSVINFFASQIYRELKNYNLSLNYIKRAIEIDSENSTFYSNLSFTYYKLYYKKDINLFKKKINKNINKIKEINNNIKKGKNYYELAYHYFLLKDLSLFIKYVEKYVNNEQTTSHELKELIEMSEFFFVRDDILNKYSVNKSELESFLGKIVRFSMNNYSKNYLFPLKLNKIDENQDSDIQNVSKSLNIYPYNELALSRRGQYYYNLANDCLNEINNNSEKSECNQISYKALSDFTYIHENYPENDFNLIFLANTYLFLLDDHVNSIKYYDKHININPNYWRQYNWIAQAQRKNNQNEKAIRNLDIAIDKLNEQKNYYSSFKTKLAELYARKFYIQKAIGNYNEGYLSVKESYSLNPNRRQYDLIESSIYNKDLKFSIENAQKIFDKTGDFSFLILKSIALLMDGQESNADKLFNTIINSPDDAYELNLKSKLERVFSYVTHYLMLKNDSTVLDYLSKWELWLPNSSDANFRNKDSYPHIYYLKAYAYLKNKKFIDASVNIEMANILFSKKDDSKLDESNYEVLTRKKIEILKSKIKNEIKNKKWYGFGNFRFRIFKYCRYWKSK